MVVVVVVVEEVFLGVGGVCKRRGSLEVKVV